MNWWMSRQSAVSLTLLTMTLGCELWSAQAQETVPAEEKVNCTYVVNRADGNRLVESRYTAVVILKPDPESRFIGEKRTPLGSDYALHSRVGLDLDSEPPWPQLAVSTWLVSTGPEEHIVGGNEVSSTESALTLNYFEAKERLKLALEKIRAVAMLEGESKTDVENQLAKVFEPRAWKFRDAGGGFDNPQVASVLAKLAARGHGRSLSLAVRQGLVPNRLVTRVTVSCVHFK